MTRRLQVRLAVADTAYNISFSQQRLKCYYESEKQFVYFGITIYNCAANAATAESSLTLYATILTVQEILANKDNIYSCAKAFRNDANTLMLQLSKEFDFNIFDCGAWPIHVYKTNRDNKGKLNEGWTFYLHGSHCRFDNLKTGQIVEVRYMEKPEFGCLDGYFFYNYMQTTEKFKELADWFANHQNVYESIEVLSEEGTLTKKKSTITGNYVIAL